MVRIAENFRIGHGFMPSELLIDFRLGAVGSKRGSIRLSIEDAEKLASDLLNAVFDATETENIKVDYEEVDKRKWEEIKGIALGMNLFAEAKRAIRSFEVSDCEHIQNLYLVCGDKKVSWSLKEKDYFKSFILHTLYEAGRKYDLVAINIDHVYGVVYG